MTEKQYSIRSVDFFEKVYDVVRMIPKGRVTSYRAIAIHLGASKSARLVGAALHLCSHLIPPVPAHRVVNSQGLLSGKHSFATPSLMADLLKKEGVEVVDDKVQHFQKLFWHPNGAED